MSGIELRTDNPVYKNEMQIFTTKIVDVAKEANLFASQGGPIILAQIENEYGDIMSNYKDAGKAYIKWCAQMALAQNIGVPWIMCQQPDAPKPIINTCNGYYCHNFQPNNPKSPKNFTENWIGTNFGRTSGGPYITTSYDYDAPIDEYENLNQPKWGHLKHLHASIKLGENVLANYSKRNDKDLANGIILTTYTNSIGERFCFLSNNDTNNDTNVDLQNDGKYFVPAWSVTILNGCNQEIFNTAKLNSQTSIMVKRSDNDNKLTWKWKMEPRKDTMHGNGNLKAYQLLEQKELSLDASDYLWYMTSVDINDTSIWSNATLRVNTMGHTLHGYVNRSATVGLANYGAWYDEIKTGISGGHVQLIGKNNATMDLSTNLWSYKVGLNGERKRLYDLQAHGVSWHTNSSYIPIGEPMIWYKA
ncbi:beta-galactosidase [Trifolium repens]|nr:beta-galactosidase [Trifolium repens]